MVMQPDELKALRKAAKHTREDMAEIIRLSPGFIGEMERGEKPIDPRTEDWVRALYAPLRAAIIVGGEWDGHRCAVAEGLRLMRMAVKGYIPPFVRPNTEAPLTPGIFYRLIAEDAESGTLIFAPDKENWTAEQALAQARKYQLAVGSAEEGDHEG